jgi:hypothetical protein
MGYVIDGWGFAIVMAGFFGVCSLVVSWWTLRRQ